MKKLITALAALMITISAFGQGAVVFNNRVPPDINAKVTLPDGTGVGAGFTAQLYGGPAGTAAGALTPLTPTTTFRTGAAVGYVNPVDVTVPGVLPGASATIVMKAFNGATFEASSAFGQSSPITVTLGGGTLPPANLTGLTGFAVVPEPSTIALGILGAGLLLFRRRK